MSLSKEQIAREAAKKMWFDQLPITGLYKDWENQATPIILSAINTALEGEDTARLDWLEQHEPDIDAPIECMREWVVYDGSLLKASRATTLRAAIDAARSASQGVESSLGKDEGQNLSSKSGSCTALEQREDSANAAQQKEPA